MVTRGLTREFPDGAGHNALKQATEMAESPFAAQRDRRNWYIHLAFVHQDYPECLRVIEEQLRECNGLCEYPIYIKGLILRMEGRIQESLALFQAAVCLNPVNPANLKQVGRCLYLLGKHKATIDVYEEASKLHTEDWEAWHNRGLCYTHLKQYAKAAECFERANSISRHDATFMQLGKVFQLQEDYKAALMVYQEALEFSPENPDILTTLGLVYLRLGENQQAFDYLGNSLTHQPKNAKAILAAGSIIQDNQDMDVALVKYRIAAVQTPNSAQLWNNIGMCFFGKGKHVASMACLKRALYLDPFEWIISYNLGLVNLATGQHASAFHYFSTSINLKPDFAASYMYLGITLSRLQDFENCCSAYEKALELEPDYVAHLNYAITLYNNDEPEKSKQMFKKFQKLFEDNDVEQDEEVLQMSSRLKTALGL